MPIGSSGGNCNIVGEITRGTAMATLAGPIVFLLPGWALLSLLLPPEHLPRQRRPDIASWLVLAMGMTLALTPIGLLYLHLVGLRIGSGLLVALLALSALVVIWRRGGVWYAWWRQPLAWRDKLAWLDAPLLALVLVMVLVLGVRLWVVRGVNVGLWGDSYQHTMITQLMLDNGGLFQSWEPYAPLRTFTYHFGFHGNVALFQWVTDWLTDNPTPRTVVLMGQYLNALAVLALYPLTVRLSGGCRWSGVLAVFAAGLLMPMPMFYVNWGRYTQLAGQVILPVALWLTIEAVEAHHWDARRLVLAMLAVAGLALTHYRVLVMYVAFLVPYLFYRLWSGGREHRPWFEPLARLTCIGSAALVIALPWLWNLRQGQYPQIAAGFIQGQVSSSWVTEYNTFGNLYFYVSWPMLVLAVLGESWTLWQRRPVALVGFWVGVVFLLTNPHFVGLPGTGLMTNFHVALSLYLPVSILAGYLVAQGLVWLTERSRSASYAMAIALLLLGFWGARVQADVLEPTARLVAPTDEQAMAWIQEHTPADSRFLVNASFAYGGSLVVGSDAGWWIPLLSGRANTTPPINYASEASYVPDYYSQTNEFVRELQHAALNDPATLQYLRQNRISHVYVGNRGGPLLSLEELLQSPYYHQVYHQDEVWIFAVEPRLE